MTDFSYMGIADSISIHAPRTGSDGGCRRGGGSHHISIHAPRTGSDARALALLPCLREISIHAPRTGSDSEWRRHKAMANKISIHAPRTGSDLREHMAAGGRVISIHAPRTGSDAIVTPAAAAQYQFQSTLPARGATSWYGYYYAIDDYFNPRSPHGERQCASIRAGCCRTFQSTLPARGATRGRHRGQPPLGISIHAPRTGSDTLADVLDDERTDFNPRSPHGERRGTRLCRPAWENFNPRSPHGERPCARY